MQNIVITGKRLLIKQPVEPGKTNSGVLLPDGYIAEYNPWQGIIVGVGTEANAELYKEGMTVMIIPAQAIALEIEDTIYLCCQTDAVVAIVPKFQRITKLKAMMGAEQNPSTRLQAPRGGN